MDDHTLLARFAAHALPLLRDVTLKSLPLFLVAGVFRLGLRRSSAAARHLLWLLTLVSLLCLPALCLCLPPWRVTMPGPSHTTTRTVATQTPSPPVPSGPPMMATAPLSSFPGVSESASETAPAASALPVADAPPAPCPARVIVSVPALIGFLWLVGVGAALGRIAVGGALARRLVRACRIVADGPLAAAGADAAAAAMGVRRPVSLRQGVSEAAPLVPMTLGGSRPLILLPRDADAWPAERLRVVLLHEMAHVRRGDWLSQMGAQFVCALYWFHPLVWWAARQMRMESEGAADDLVLGHGVRPADYAGHLLDVVQGLSAAGRFSLAAAVVPMARRRELAGRLRTILAPGRPRGGVGRRGLVVAAVALACLVGPLAALRPVASVASQAAAPDAALAAVSGTTALPSSDAPAPAAPASDEPPIPEPLASEMAGRSPWKTTLPNGTQVRLLSVAAIDPLTRQWADWKPDGTERESWSDPILFGFLNQRSDSWSGRELVMGLVFPSARVRHTATISVGVPGQMQMAQTFNEGAPFPRRHDLMRLFQDFPASRPKADIQVSLASGPETTLISTPPRHETVRSLPPQHPGNRELVMMSQAIAHSPGDAQVNGRAVDTTEIDVRVPTRFVHLPCEYRFTVIGLDGQPFPTRHGSSSFPMVTGKTAQLRYDFRTSELPLDRVKEFRFTYRPAQTVIFHNVALRPQGSLPKAAALHITPSQKAAVSQPARSSGTVGSGHNSIGIRGAVGDAPPVTATNGPAPSDPTPGGPAPTAPPTTPAPDSAPVTLAFVTNNPSDYWNDCRAGAEAAARELPGVSLQFVETADGTMATQEKDVDDLLAKGVQGIAVSPVDPANETDYLNTVAAQVPLVTADSDAPQSRRLCFVGSDNHAAGVQAGRLIREALPRGGKIMLFVGKRDAQNAAEREQGIRDALRGSNIQMLGVLEDNADHGRAVSNAADALAQHPDLAGMMGIWSYNGPAIWSAVQRAHKTGLVKIVCFDSNAETLVGVASGAIYASVTQKAYKFGYDSIRLLAQIARGDTSHLPATKRLIVPMTVLRKADASRSQRATIVGPPTGVQGVSIALPPGAVTQVQFASSRAQAGVTTFGRATLTVRRQDKTIYLLRADKITVSGGQTVAEGHVALTRVPTGMEMHADRLTLVPAPPPGSARKAVPTHRAP